MSASNADIELAEQRVELAALASVRRVQAKLRAEGSMICIRCDEPIEPERTAALPSARRCIECETLIERLKRRRA